MIRARVLPLSAAICRYLPLFPRAGFLREPCRMWLVRVGARWSGLSHVRGASPPHAQHRGTARAATRLRSGELSYG